MEYKNKKELMSSVSKNPSELINVVIKENKIRLSTLCEEIKEPLDVVEKQLKEFSPELSILFKISYALNINTNDFTKFFNPSVCKKAIEQIHQMLMFIKYKEESSIDNISLIEVFAELRCTMSATKQIKQKRITHILEYALLMKDQDICEYVDAILTKHKNVFF